MQSPDRRVLLAAPLLLALPARRAAACEFFAANLRVLHPNTRATPQDAPFANVSLRIDEVSEDDRLIGAATPVARIVELAGDGLGPAIDLPVPQGRETVLAAPGVHLRLRELTRPLEIARAYPFTLVFERGGPLRAQLNVDYARFL